jgi:hypothetical protein
MREVWWNARARACVLAVTLCAACGPELGECDPTALGGTPGDATTLAAPHRGQVIIDAKCSNARCHSIDARNALRVGAPAELNFDVVPPLACTTQNPGDPECIKVLDGAATVYDWRTEMWSLIESGAMPPAPPAAARLNGDEKETIRNWLACGAPVIPVPEPVVATVDWADIYDDQLQRQCAGCHSQVTAASGDGFVLGDAGDACGAYDRVVNAAAITTAGVPPCAGSGRQLVVPNDPAASLLLTKLEGTQDCGAPMPFGTPLGPNHPIVQNLRAWIMNGAPRPMGCP